MEKQTADVLEELEQILSEVHSLIGQLEANPPEADDARDRVEVAKRMAEVVEGELESLAQRKESLAEGGLDSCFREAPSLESCVSMLSPKSDTLVLQVSTAEETAFLRFRGGRLSDACSDQTPGGGRLGDVLVTMGAVSREELEHSVSDPERNGRRIGDYLLERKRITPRHLEAALDYQRRQILERLARAAVLKVGITPG